ncbi:MAG: YmdB family metallophosphoesterase [Planctomycetaceae bacterium]|nr:YmdB family metallophosphoesterase [Planctomycetaceae bacterium]
MSVSAGTIRILALGDCVGKPGRFALRDGIPYLREHAGVDFVVANVENAAHGFGVNPKLAQQLLDYGIDVMTSGDHIRDRREIDSFLIANERLLKPINYIDMPGPGVCVVDGPGGVRIGIANIIGRTFMDDDCGSPLVWADKAFEMMGDARIKLFDLHGEATSEKVALGWHLDGRASAAWGTHTHVQTADETIRPGGMGYVTDLGFCGGHLSVLGRIKENVIARQLGSSEARLEIADGWPQLDGCIFDVDVVTGKCVHVERVQHKLYADVENEVTAEQTTPEE